MEDIKQIAEKLSLHLRGIQSEINPEELENFVNHEYNKEISRIPIIAIIGATGVGKSSTINSLFGTSLHVSHTKAGTHIPKRISVNLKGQRIKGRKGDLILYDMPGIDEDLASEKEYIEIYKEIITNCDVAVWVLSAPDRRYFYDQVFIRDVIENSNEDLTSRLVIAINKVDLIDPYDWDKNLNLPSIIQEKNLYSIRQNVFSKFRKVCPGLSKDRVIAYSALRRYRLDDLFGAMLNACPEDRSWVLNTRQEIANFWDLVSPEIREQVEIIVGGNR